MSEPRSTWTREELARLRAQVAVLKSALAQIDVQGDPALAEKQASTQRLIEALCAQADAVAEQLGIDPPRVLH